jgi:ribonuclease BN (tRNA processing enzyme)
LQQGLHICTQRGTISDLNAFVREPFTVPFSGLPYPSDITGLEEGVQTTLPFIVECLLLVHPAACFGFRLEIDGKVITYCTDTGVCDNAVVLARNADLLITECGLKPGDSSPDWPHLNPQDAIMIATKSGAKRLALLHFGAEVYRTLEERKALRDQFEHLSPGLIIATDDLTVDI